MDARVRRALVLVDRIINDEPLFDGYPEVGLHGRQDYGEAPPPPDLDDDPEK